MAERVRNVLFLCTHNSARSIIAESVLNHLGQGRFKAFSAGSHPKASPNPAALETLQRMGFSTESLHSKSWDAFGPGRQAQMDIIITVCDDAASEVCPVWPGAPATAHWGVADPSRLEGTSAKMRRAFADTAMILRRRIELLLALPAEKLDQRVLGARLNEIGRS